VTRALTSRQIEVLRLLASGLGRRQVAHALGISPFTVRAHVEQARIRLDAPDLATAWRKLGWLEPPCA